MNSNIKNTIFKLLNSYSTEIIPIDRIIVSLYLYYNKINVVNNRLVKSYQIVKEDNNEYEFLKVIINSIPDDFVLNIEDLIEIFEYVISPSDKIINGAIYTPSYIREYIIDQTFSLKKDFLDIKIADLSCGCGGFLYSVAKKLKEITQLKYSKIFRNNLFGLDIQKYSVNRSEILLTLLAISENEDEDEFIFNINSGDSLIYSWKANYPNFVGFDIVLGNPPYVGAKNLSLETKKKIKFWDVSKSGNPDLYIPFFQIGIENLCEDGILGYITMNTFFKSLNGRELRKYFSDKELNIKIIDFGSTQIFKSKNTYTCICFIQNNKKKYIKYIRLNNKQLPTKNDNFQSIKYCNLDSFKGWNLQNHKIIEKIESTGTPLGKLFKTRHGIATLRNNIYIFKPIHEDSDFYYLKSEKIYPIERGICKEILNTNKLSRNVDFDLIKEKIIFPYHNLDKPRLFEEKYFKDKFPNAYKYLKDNYKDLGKRDNGNREYENWFAFGRTQSLERISNKLFFPKMTDRTPSFILNEDPNLLFYNGQAIVGHSQREMNLIRKFMESDLFWYYIQSTSKPYTSGYYSLNGNYIKNFGICDLTESEIDFILREDNNQKINLFFERKYDIKIN
ncbi:HsdM family class I SAM-dependent methyltransferase [Chryseobacterium culicis]|uniref:site-specific DNA-methyltransferase (adenine-specific) n=1 Tax=Chryseobacterium culicis TaxID=680127 RepID=A0A1H6GVG7_CHRCI|nr:N-6 DNA methylase [Chryseobacterium culicis]SEH27477.1 N-6 DNA Methylase [Chryseobacterium culicis]